MATSHEIQALTIALQANIPTIIWGPPGAGKSSAIRQIADALNLHLEVVTAAIREPSDFAGLPIIQGDGVRFAAPTWAKRLGAAGKGILFYDELSCAPPAVQAGVLRTIFGDAYSKRYVGDEALPDGVCIAAAANPPDQAAGGWELAPPMANRLLHLKWTLQPGQFVEGMLGGWAAPTITPLPETWREGIPQYRSLIASYIQNNPHKLYVMPKDSAGAGMAWPSPRSWDMLATLMAAAASKGASDDVMALLVIGCVGEGVGMEFFHWQKALDLPDTEELIRTPATLDAFLDKSPRGDQIFAVLAGVSAAVAANMTKERWLSAWKVFHIAVTKGPKDVAAAAARNLALAGKAAKMPNPGEEMLKPFEEVLKAAGVL